MYECYALRGEEWGKKQAPKDPGGEHSFQVWQEAWPEQGTHCHVSPACASCSLAGRRSRRVFPALERGSQKGATSGGLRRYQRPPLLAASHGQQLVRAVNPLV